MFDTLHALQRDPNADPIWKQFKFRAGVHTGFVLGATIGSEVVRYDIFGEGIIGANKYEAEC